MSEMRSIRFKINGKDVETSVSLGETVVETLTRRFGLRGARESCGQGLCGCCTVLIDGLAISGCLQMSVFLDNTEVITIEGLSCEGELDIVQTAFLETGAFQCGFCTPGFIMTVKQLLRDIPDPSDDDIRHYLSGNLCRCSAYPEIMNAVRLAAKRSRVSVETFRESNE